MGHILNRIKVAVFVACGVTLIFVLSAKGAVGPNFGGPECQALVGQYFKENKIHIGSLKWSESGSSSYSSRVFRAPLGEIGSWLQVEVKNALRPDQQVSMGNLKNGRVEKSVVWKDSKCSKFEPRAQEKLYSIPTFQVEKSEIAFDDQAFSDLVQSGKSGMIYVWSPRMVYSVTDFGRFQQAAKAAGLEFVSVVSDQVPQDEAALALKTRSIEYSKRKLASMDLYLRGATLHFPSVFIYANKKVHSNRIIGIYKKDDLNILISGALKDLK